MNEPLKIKRHYRSSSPEKLDEIADLAAELIVAYLKGEGKDNQSITHKTQKEDDGKPN